MKAGIYRTPNGNLIYVAKDRTVKASVFGDLIGKKVSHRVKDNTVVVDGGDYRCEHVCDVPNGCTDHARVLVSAQTAWEVAQRQAIGGMTGVQTVTITGPAGQVTVPVKKIGPCNYIGNVPPLEVDHGTVEDCASRFNPTRLVNEDRRYYIVPNVLDAPYTQAEMADWRDKKVQQYLACGWRLCHRKSARKHRKARRTVLDIGDGRYMWHPMRLYPYQESMIRRLLQTKNVALSAFEVGGFGKTGVRSGEAACTLGEAYDDDRR